MRILVLTVLIAFLGCGGGQKNMGPGAGDGSGTGTATTAAAPRLDLHCTPQAGFDEPACAARGEGCGYGPPLICRGIDVDDATREREREAYEAGVGLCECICPEARMQCAMVP